MGKTFDTTPISIKSYFEEIVGIISDNLSTDTDFSEDIPQVSFKHGTWADICNELMNDNVDPNKKSIKYPLICLIYKTDEKYLDRRHNSFEVDLLICTNSDRNLTNDRRYEDKYDTILMPIYAELKAVLSNYKKFIGYNQRFEHTKTDLPKAGSESGDQKGTNLADIIDGIYLKGCRFIAANDLLDYTAPNLCELTSCPYGIDLYFYTVFKEVVISGLNGSTLSVSVNDWDHLDATVPMALPAPFAPEIDWYGDSNFVPLTAGATVSDPFTGSKANIGVQYGDGVFRGVIKNGNASVEFYYKVLGGQIVKLTTEIRQSIEFSILCADFVQYGSYPFTITGYMKMEKVNTEPSILSAYELTTFGVSKANETYGSPFVDEIDETTESSLLLGDSNQTIVNNFSYNGGQSPLQSISIFKTRCKTEF